jgi:hypothetical protein
MGARGAKGASARGAGARSAIGARGAWLGCVLVATISCAPKTAPAVASPAAPAPVPGSTSVATAAVELPDGPGRQILNKACVSCHNLTEVTKFRGFYTRPQWRDIVQTMVDYGAPVNEKDAEVLTTYLAETLGKK